MVLTFILRQRRKKNISMVKVFATTLMTSLMLANLVMYPNKETCLELLVYALVFGVIIEVTESQVLRVCFLIFYGMQLTASVLVPLLKVFLH